MTTKLYPFKFTDSGKVVSIRKVSYNLASELRKIFPPPEPPIVEVPYPNGIRREENALDPDYARTLRRYNVEFEERLRRLVIRRGVVIVLGDAEKEEIRQLRDDMKEEGIPLPENDQDVYLSYICISTPEDYKDLLGAVTRRSYPTEEGSADALDRFRPEGEVPAGDGADVSREKHIQN